jgi:hypothetical protein
MKPASRLSNISKAVLERITRKAEFSYLLSSLYIVGIFTTMVLLVLFSTGTVWAQAGHSSVTQTVTIEVKPITRLSVTGNPNPLMINDAVPGSSLLSVSDENTKYSLTTNLDNMKIVASINDRMPTGTKLLVKLSSSKASSTGLVDLSGALSPVDVVTGLSKASDMNQSISYTFAANSDVYDIPTQTRVVTFTLSN